MDFFRTLAQRVAENLLNHVDGKLDEKCSNSSTGSENIPSYCSKLNLTEYNFPADFDLSRENCKLDILLDCNFTKLSARKWTKALESVEKLQKSSTTSSSSNSSSNGSQSSYLCCVCGEAFTSTHEFDEHEVNNHPNVCCSYVEIDFVRNMPSHLLSWNHNSPKGVLRSCTVPPTLSKLAEDSQSIKCTKCNKSFTVASQFHQHIVDCAAFDCSDGQNLNASSQTSSTASQTSLYYTRSSKRRLQQLSGHHSKFCGSPLEAVTFRKCDVAVQVCLGNKLLPQRGLPASGDTENGFMDENQEEIGVPRRYACSKCSKRFMYLVTLKKHQLSCSKLFRRKGRHKAIVNNYHKLSSKRTQKEWKRAKADKNGAQIELKVKCKKGLHKTFRNQISSRRICREDSSRKQLQPEDKMSAKLTNIQEHKCPKCQRTFTYLANFKKHVKKNCSPKLGINKSADNCSKYAEEVQTINGGNELISLEKAGASVKKMQSKEQDVPKGAELEDGCTSQLKEGSKLDLWRIKQEHPLYAFKGSPAQHHSCPYCQRGFTYLANYRKHINGICPIRQQIDNTKSKLLEEKETTNSKVAANVLETPQSESSTLPNSKSLLTPNQSNEASQSQSKNLTISDSIDEKAAKDGSNSNEKASAGTEETDGQKFRTFSCNICHRIYLSHVKMLRHMLSHKLADGTANSLENLPDLCKEKTIAKLALQRQAVDSEKRKGAAGNARSNTSIQSAIPCANLLENLARGGPQDNGDRFLEDGKEKGSAPHVNLLIPAKKSVENSSVDEALVDSENNNNNNNYAIVIQEDADINDLATLESLTPELLNSLKGELAQLVTNPDDSANAIEEVVLNLNPSDSESGEFWITFTTDEAENTDDGAFLQLSRPMSL